jgi:hypothetical protein
MVSIGESVNLRIMFWPQNCEQQNSILYGSDVWLYYKEPVDGFLYSGEFELQTNSQGRIEIEQRGRSPWGLHKTRIESTDFVTKSASLKLWKVILYF